jgi:tRNA-modifying protein YgfZ
MPPLNHAFTWLHNQAPVVIAKGAEATNMLHGQLGANIKTMHKDQCQFTAICNHKGRVLTSVFILKITPDHYLLISQNCSEAQFVQQHLMPFARLSKIELTLSEDSALWFTKPPPNEPTHRQTNLASTPPSLPTCFKLHSNLNLALGPLQIVQPYQQILPASQSGEQAWYQWMMHAGLAPIHAPTRGLFTPDQLNYLAHQAVSVTKGCYVGQEIIARLYHLGNSKKKLTHFTINTNHPLPPGYHLTHNKLPCGTIICSAQTSTHTLGLAVLNKKNTLKSLLTLDQGALTLTT